MPLVKVGPAKALSPGSVQEVENGDATYAVCNVDGKLFAVDGLCPHAGGPLGQGNLNGSMLVCPWHGWEFNCQTGVNDFDEDLQLKTYPVVVQGDDVLIDIS